MYLYYFSHSFWNQFKRFARTWAFVMVIVFITIGGPAGLCRPLVL